MNQHTPSPPTDSWWWFGELAKHRVRAEQTNDAMSIVEILAPPGLSVPPHVHHREDEAFVILDGGGTFHVGDRTVEAKPGDVLFGPRGVVHDYTVGPKGCRMLFIFTPGRNMESFIAESGVRAAADTLPPAEIGPPEAEQLAGILQRHGLAFA
ncbi:MAG: cupin domain-containing protein [Rhizobiaceae bacterium]|nr:cupin domain-containing protein [Rhizobiaceae bacterium]